MHTRIATTNGATPMTTRSRDTRTALAAYMEHHVEVTEILERILEHYRNHDDAPADGLHWGHVGDIAETRRTLQEISDSLFSEGEYAEVACLGCPATVASGDALGRHYATAH